MAKTASALEKNIEIIREREKLVSRGLKIYKLYDSYAGAKKDTIKAVLSRDYQGIKCFDDRPSSFNKEGLEEMLERRFPSRKKVKELPFTDGKLDILQLYFVAHECALELDANLIVTRGSTITLYKFD